MRFTTAAEVPSPILAHGHGAAAALCEECTGNMRIAAAAVVSQILTWMRNAGAGSSARAHGYGLITRICGYGPLATLAAYDYLAESLEAEACPHMRDPLGAPDIFALLAAMPAHIVEDVARGVEGIQRYLSHRAASTAPSSRGPAEAAGLNLVDPGRARLGLAVLVLACAGAELHPPHDVVITAASIAAAAARGTDHAPCPSIP